MKISRALLFYLVSIGILAAFAYFLYVNADKYLSLVRISGLSVAGILIISVIFTGINGMINVDLFGSAGIKMSLKEGFFLSAVSTLTNQLPVSGGLISKGIYLKRRHGFSYMKFASSTLALFICFVSVNGLIGTSILLGGFLFFHIPPVPVLLAGFSGMAASLLLFLVPTSGWHGAGRLGRWLAQVVEGWHLIGHNRRLAARLIILQTFLMLLLAVRYWLAFQMLSQDVTIAQVILFASASVLTQLVSLAPGGLGVREAIVAIVASALGFDAAVVVVAVGLDRLVNTAVVFILGFLGILFWKREYASTSSDRASTR